MKAETKSTIKTLLVIVIVLAAISYFGRGHDKYFAQKIKEAKEYDEYREDVLRYEFEKKVDSLKPLNIE